MPAPRRDRSTIEFERGGEPLAARRRGLASTSEQDRFGQRFRIGLLGIYGGQRECRRAAGRSS